MPVIKVISPMGRFVRLGLQVLAQRLKVPMTQLPIAQEKMTLDIVTALLVHQLLRQHPVEQQLGESGASVHRQMGRTNLV